LQYLTSLVVNKGTDKYKRVIIDTENYRKKREETLVKLAKRLAAKAKRTGRRVVLEPMNPYERRILHSTLQNHPYVQTHSEGEDPNRRVVITLK
jgi:spoIIIJ-associated protein